MPIASTSFSIVIAASIGIVTALAAALLPDPASSAALSLVDDNRLRLICVAGILAPQLLAMMHPSLAAANVVTGAGYRDSVADVDAVRLLLSSGTFAGGKVRLFGWSE